jgi:hypothetical protein
MVTNPASPRAGGRLQSLADGADFATTARAPAGDRTGAAVAWHQQSRR